MCNSDGRPQTDGCVIFMVFPSAVHAFWAGWCWAMLLGRGGEMQTKSVGVMENGKDMNQK